MTRERAIMIAIAWLVAFGCARGIESRDRTGRIGSHSLHAVVAGTGFPAVVIDGGIAAGCDEYRELQDRIAPTTTAIIYDRAGYGPSEAGPLPRDSRREVEELRSLLSAMNIPPPFVLVGHSLGALNAQVFAGQHPEEVAGLVLLDPPPAGFILGEDFPELRSMANGMTEQWQQMADDGPQADFFRMLASEHREMFAGSARQAVAIASFGAIPLVVVASGVPNPGFGVIAEAYQQYWAEQSKALVAKSSRGRFVYADRSTHRLQVDAVDRVVDEIEAVLDSLRNPTR